MFSAVFSPRIAGCFLHHGPKCDFCGALQWLIVKVCCMKTQDVSDLAVSCGCKIFAFMVTQNVSFVSLSCDWKMFPLYWPKICLLWLSRVIVRYFLYDDPKINVLQWLCPAIVRCLPYGDPKYLLWFFPVIVRYILYADSKCLKCYSLLWL